MHLYEQFARSRFGRVTIKSRTRIDKSLGNGKRNLRTCEEAMTTYPPVCLCPLPPLYHPFATRWLNRHVPFDEFQSVQLETARSLSVARTTDNARVRYIVSIRRCTVSNRRGVPRLSRACISLSIRRRYLIKRRC